MRICIDLDGVICKLKQPHETYADVEPIEDSIEKIRALKEAGHYIIVYTARHMKTCQGNISMVIARIGQMTLEWLAKYEVPFDEILFGKPWADVYIDDNALRFTSWQNILDDGSNLPLSNEKTIRGDE